MAPSNEDTGTKAAQINAVVRAIDGGMKSKILMLYHDDPMSGGHAGVKSTPMKISSRFSWPNMRTEIEAYVTSCHVRQMTKFKFKPKIDILTVPHLAETPYETIHLDFGELAKRSEGVRTTRSFIVIVDEYTRMFHAQTIRESSRAVIACLEQQPFVTLLKKIISDNGSAFRSAEFHKWCQSRGISQIFSAVYNP